MLEGEEVSEKKVVVDFHVLSRCKFLFIEFVSRGSCFPTVLFMHLFYILSRSRDSKSTGLFQYYFEPRDLSTDEQG